MNRILPLLLILILPLFVTAQSEINFSQGSVIQTEALTTISVPVTISTAATDTILVSLIQTSGTATQINDFDIVQSQLVFPKDSTNSQNLNLNIYEDIISEGPETATFTLVYQSGNGVIGGSSTLTLTIADNDSVVISFSPTSITLPEGSGVYNIPVILTGTPANTVSVTVTFSFANSTATIGTDFLFSNALATWPANTSGVINVPINITDDFVHEINETAILLLVNPSANIMLGDSVFTTAIIDNDTLPTGTCSNLFFSEYFEGSGSNQALEFYNPTSNPIALNNYRLLKYTDGASTPTELQLSGFIGAQQTFVLAYPTTGPTIANAADAVSSFINFDGNDAIVLLHATDTIDVIGIPGQNPGSGGWLVLNGNGSTYDHPLIRSPYTYQGSTNWLNGVNTWRAGLYDIADSLGFHHIKPCGTPPPFPPSLVGFVLTSDTVVEDSVLIPVLYFVENQSDTDAAFVVKVDIPFGNATFNADYVYTTDTIHAPPGVYTDTVFIQLWKDDQLEAIEFIRIYMEPLAGNNTIVSQPNHSLYIISDTALFVSFLGAGYTYAEDTGTVQVRLFVTKPMPSATDVTIALAPGSATLGSDYNFTNNIVVSFPANTADTLSFDVTILNDNIEEPNEQVNFDIVNATNNARHGIWAYTLSIVDNDSTVGIKDENLDLIAKAYPNPAHGNLFINAAYSLQNIKICDLLGAVVITAPEIQKGLNTLDISAICAGMYFISVQMDGIRYTKKIIIR